MLIVVGIKGGAYCDRQFSQIQLLVYVDQENFICLVTLCLRTINLDLGAYVWSTWSAELNVCSYPSKFKTILSTCLLVNGHLSARRLSRIIVL